MQQRDKNSWIVESKDALAGVVWTTMTDYVTAFNSGGTVRDFSIKSAHKSKQRSELSTQPVNILG